MVPPEIFCRPRKIRRLQIARIILLWGICLVLIAHPNNASGQSDDHGMTFVKIPYGSFEIPLCQNCRNQLVILSESFYLGAHEVTQAQWRSIMGDGNQPWRSIGGVRYGDEYPAVHVSWNDVQRFISKLNAMDDNYIYDLPTSAQWEYACQAGARTAFYFGNDPSELKAHAWYRDNTEALQEFYPHEVGLKLPNRWGLYDVHGNVTEWVKDAATLVQSGWCGIGFGSSEPVVTDPAGIVNGAMRRVRGGHYAEDAQALQTAVNNCFSPDHRSRTIGFRLVRRPR